MSNTRKASDVLLGKGKPPQSTVAVYLRGDLVSAIEDAEREMEAARATWTRTKMADEDPGKPLAAKIEKLRAEMQDSEVVLTLRAIPRKQKSDLVTAHPSPEPSLLFEHDGFFTSLVQACCVDPTFDTAEQVGQFYDEIGAAQADLINTAAWKLVTDRVSIPFSVAASVLIQDSEPK